MTTKQLEQKEQALEAKLNGKAYGKTHEVARGQYVELAREGEGAIWTVLGEFADLEHNTFAEPDRTVDNTTIWVPDFSSDHYLDLLFDDAPGANSMRNFYIEQSANRTGPDFNKCGGIQIGSSDYWVGKYTIQPENGGVGVFAHEYGHDLGLFVILPKKAVTTNIGEPYAGSNYYYSGSGDNLNNFMYKAFNLAAASTLTAKVNYSIELNWDYANLVVSTDGGATWTSLQTNLSTTTDPNGQTSATASPASPAAGST